MEARHPLEEGPIHRAVWGGLALDAFDCRPRALSDEVEAALAVSTRLVRRHLDDGTLYDDGTISEEVIRELAAAGFFAIPAPLAHGGLGGSFDATAAVVARMSEVDPYVAGLLSTQACLGPLGCLASFGTPDQQRRLIPPLARGERLGAFAVTEPIASSDWGALRCVARLKGDVLLLTGEKVLITNAAPGRTVSVLCRVDGRFELLVVELPAHENEHFQVVRYGIEAPAHLANAGLRFHALRVPAANVIRPPRGDGRTVAHHALNRGRVAICGFAAGALRRMAGELIPWVQARKSFGAAIGTRELVRHRLGRLAGRIVACDALLAWSSRLLDEGHHGQLECVTAKVFASEALTEMLTDVLLKTTGGRAFLEGSYFTRFAFDALATPVYEGENEILSLGFHRSLCRSHARSLAELGLALRDVASTRSLDAALRAGGALAGYAGWAATQHLRTPLRDPSPEGRATRVLQEAALEISTALRHWGEDAARRQAFALELAQRVQLATVILVVSRYGARQDDVLVRAAARAVTEELAERLTGARSTERTRGLLADVGAAVAEGRFPLIAPETIARAAPPRMLDRLERAVGRERSGGPGVPRARGDERVPGVS